MSKNFNETLDVGNSDGYNVLSLQMKTSPPSVTALAYCALGPGTLCCHHNRDANRGDQHRNTLLTDPVCSTLTCLLS